MPDTRELLIAFLKAPRLGFVKTRLASTVGNETALAIYNDLVAVTLHAAARLENVELRFSPDNAAVEVALWRRAPWKAQPQGSGDLGARLMRAFADAFASGFGRVAVIGSDCPDIAAADIEDAWKSLGDHDLVLGPAQDGGYWLIALKRPIPQLFENIDWSTERVLKQTLAIAEKLNLKTRLLRTLRDVDTYDDWLATKGPSPAANARARGEVGGPEH